MVNWHYAHNSHIEFYQKDCFAKEDVDDDDDDDDNDIYVKVHLWP
jgi:hypothetical protein